MEVVGVVADTRDSGLDQLVTSDIYLPEKLFPQTHMVLIVETLAKPLSLATSVSDVIRTIDQDAIISNVQSMDQLIRRTQA